MPDISGRQIMTRSLNMEHLDLSGFPTASNDPVSKAYLDSITSSFGMTTDTGSATGSEGDTIYYINNVPAEQIITYTNSTPTTATVGGIEAGSTFYQAPLTDLFNALLHPDVIPQFTAFSITNYTQSYEVGQLAPSGTYQFTWTLYNTGSVVTGSLQILSGSTIISQPTGGISLVSPTTCSFNSMTSTTVTSKYFTIKVKKTNNAYISKTYACTWYYPVYYGVSADPNIFLSGSYLVASSSKVLTNTLARTYTYPTSSYKYICIPNSFGGISVIKDAATQLSLAMADASDGFVSSSNGINYYPITLTNAYGVSSSYKVYRTKYELGNSMNITIS